MPRRTLAFAALVAAGVVSAIGSGLTAFALAVEAFRRTGDATAVGLIAAAGMLPMILVAPFAGVWADRWDRRALMLLGDGGSAIALVAVAAQLADPTAPLWRVGLALAVSSAFAGLTEPAMRATVSDLVPPERLDRAAGLVQLAGALRWLVAPALASLLMLVMPVWGIVGIDIATFAVTLAATMLVRSVLGRSARRPRRASAIADFRDGLALLRGTDLARLIGAMTVATAAVGALQALFTPLVLSFADTATLGALTSIAASGMLVGALLIGAFGVRARLHGALAAGFAIAGIALIGVGMRPSPLLVGAAALVFFVSIPLVSSSAEVLLRRNVPNERLGRVWGLVGLVTQLGTVGAFLVSGPIVDGLLTPAMRPGGALTPLLGPILGTGPGRGVAVLLAVAGVALLLVALWTRRSAAIARLALAAPESAQPVAAHADPTAVTPDAAELPGTGPGAPGSGSSDSTDADFRDRDPSDPDPADPHPADRGAAAPAPSNRSGGTQ